eukprot:scaffold162511_cov18-Tisochrysis_lutea.AAC.1
MAACSAYVQERTHQHWEHRGQGIAQNGACMPWLPVQLACKKARISTYSISSSASNIKIVKLPDKALAQNGYQICLHADEHSALVHTHTHARARIRAHTHTRTQTKTQTHARADKYTDTHTSPPAAFQGIASLFCSRTQTT